MNYTNRELQESVKILEAIYNDTRELTPIDTVNQYCKAVGDDLAHTTVAMLIKQNSWDGRISPEAKAWSDRISEDADIYTSIHKAHLDQIAKNMIS